MIYTDGHLPPTIIVYPHYNTRYPARNHANESSKGSVLTRPNFVKSTTMPSKTTHVKYKTLDNAKISILVVV